MLARKKQQPRNEKWTIVVVLVNAGTNNQKPYPNFLALFAHSYSQIVVEPLQLSWYNILAIQKT